MTPKASQPTASISPVEMARINEERKNLCARIDAVTKHLRRSDADPNREYWLRYRNGLMICVSAIEDMYKLERTYGK